jgi:hypothetical protein
MKQNLKLILTLTLLGLAAYAAYAETITITSYYPSPYGSYQDLYVSGKLGIGTTSPGASLDVFGPTGTSLLKLSNANGSTEWGAQPNGDAYAGSATPGRNFQLYAGGSLAETILANGNVGIGTIPAYKLDVDGDIQAGGFYYPSDASMKKDIVTIPNALVSILRLRGVEFNWKKNGKPSFGIVAQEVQKVYPELVNTDARTGLQSVAYGNLIGPLIEAIKEQQKQMDTQKKSIEELQKEVKKSRHV